MIEYKGRELWTYFFTKPKNYYNQYMYKMVEYPEYLMFSNDEIINSKGKWNKVFNNDNPIHLEIGSGSGNFAISMAKKNEKINYLCDELRLKRLVFSAKKSKKENLKNIKFIRYDANNLTEFLGENEIDTLYINFPDPWEGSEHKRMLSDNLLSNLDTVMKKGGKIYFKTDHLDYYLNVLNLINESSKYDVVRHTDNLYETDLKESNIQTEFEHLFIHKIKTNIKYVEIIKL
ncbi:tRNA (guanosine(46)-N7)-methyltransferase TrmB [Oceanivirga salmonicida]|uniref:tRNA (guanosine(46)-N7)-methyltransferase TrmB n=1 Tax=Oceanivirga salmonicida TaxID=1769291 RepID=UPI0012E20484|nr:tRNA (guanosine(46)-N7)-methyltransferase TrmB [Oceanivirga salmonicida]